MSTSLAEAFRKANPQFRVVRYHAVPNGTVFLPIEKMGPPIYYRDNFNRIRADRKWKKGSELYVKASNSSSRSLHRNADGIFSLGDWCVVKSVN